QTKRALGWAEDTGPPRLGSAADQAPARRTGPEGRPARVQPASGRDACNPAGGASAGNRRLCRGPLLPPIQSSGHSFTAETRRRGESRGEKIFKFLVFSALISASQRLRGKW